MEPEPGHSGQKHCPSCKKYAPQFQRKVCDDCWIWFKENVDDFYHNEMTRVNGRLQCPNQSLTSNCLEMTCPHCRINIFLNITGYTSTFYRCCTTCGSRTILKLNKCSKCVRLHNSTTAKLPPQQNQPQLEKSYLKDIPKNLRGKAQQQLRSGCSVVLDRKFDLPKPESSTTTVDKPEQCESSTSHPTEIQNDSMRKVQEQPSSNSSIVHTRKFDLLSNRNCTASVEKPKQIKSSTTHPSTGPQLLTTLTRQNIPLKSTGTSSNRVNKSKKNELSTTTNNPSTELQPTAISTPNQRVTKRLSSKPPCLCEGSSCQNIPKKRKLVDASGEIYNSEMEESSRESSDPHSAGNQSSTGERLEANRKNKSDGNQMKSSKIQDKNRKPKESRNVMDRMEKTAKKKSIKEKDPVKKMPSFPSKGKESRLATKLRESLRSQNPKVTLTNPSVGLPHLLPEIPETSSKAAEPHCEPANPALVPTSSGRKNHSDMPATHRPSTRFQWKIVNQRSVPEASQRPPVKLVLKLHPATSHKSRERNLANKNLSINAPGSNLTVLMDAEPSINQSTSSDQLNPIDKDRSEVPCNSSSSSSSNGSQIAEMVSTILPDMELPSRPLGRTEPMAVDRKDEPGASTSGTEPTALVDAELHCNRSTHPLDQPDLVSKDRSVDGSSTLRVDFTILADAVEPPSLSLDQPDPTTRFDHLSSDNNRVNPPSEEEIVPEEEKANLVRAELVPLRNSAPSQMTLSVQDAARADAQPDGNLLEVDSNDSDYESMEFENTMEEVLPNPERIVQATEEQLPVFPRVDPIPCLGFIRIGKCQKVDCRFGHSVDLKSLFQLTQKWLLAKDFIALDNLIFLVASKSSPFRESLWSDDGQEVVYTVISAFLNEKRDDLTEMALSIISSDDIPLKYADICEKTIEQAATNEETAAYLSALLKRLDHLGFTVSVEAWNKIISVLVSVKNWDETIAAVGAAFKSHPEYTPTLQVLEFLFEMEEKEKLMKVVDMFKTYQPSAFKQLNVAKREEIVELMSQDTRTLFDLPIPTVGRNPAGRVPETQQNENPAIPNEMSNGLFSHLNRPASLIRKFENPRPMEPLDLRILTIE